MNLSFQHIILVFLGGGMGSVMRYILNILLNQSNYKVPYGTLLANIVGCLFIGVLAGYFQKNQNTYIYLLLAVGFCGGFTTFASLSNEMYTMLKNNQVYTPIIYLFVSVFTGLAATLIGYSVSK